MLNLARLRLLRDLAARGTIAAVADALAYTPSAVSQQLAQLEREAGVPLLERAGRGVRLTDAGRTLAAHAEALLERAELAQADLEAAAGAVSGTVRVAAFQTATLYLLAPALRALAARHPGVRVEVAEVEAEDALPALALGRWDLVLADEYDGLPRPRHARVHVEPLLREPILLVLPRAHPLAREGGPVALAGLERAAWATGLAGTDHAEMAVRACRSLGGFEPDVRHRSNDLLILLELVASAGAAALLPRLVPAAGNPDVVVRTVAGRAPARTIASVVRAGSARRPAVAALQAALRVQAAGAQPGDVAGAEPPDHASAFGPGAATSGSAGRSGG